MKPNTYTILYNSKRGIVESFSREAFSAEEAFDDFLFHARFGSIKRKMKSSGTVRVIGMNDLRDVIVDVDLHYNLSKYAGATA